MVLVACCALLFCLEGLVKAHTRYPIRPSHPIQCRKIVGPSVSLPHEPGLAIDLLYICSRPEWDHQAGLDRMPGLIRAHVLRYHYGRGKLLQSLCSIGLTLSRDRQTGYPIDLIASDRKESPRYAGNQTLRRLLSLHTNSSGGDSRGEDGSWLRWMPRGSSCRVPLTNHAESLH